MKMIKQELLQYSKGLFLLCHQRKTVKNHGNMIRNFTKEEMKLKDFSSESSVSEKFLLIMINLILFILLSLLFP